MVSALKAEDVVEAFKETHQKKVELLGEQQRLLSEIAILEETLQSLSQMKGEKKQSLAKHREEITLKLPLMARLARVNPLRIVVDPTVSQNTLRGLIVLRAFSTSLKLQIQQVQAELNEVAALSSDVKEKTESLTHLLQGLEIQKAELTTLENQKLENITKNELKRLAKEEDINTLLDESRAVLSKKERVAKIATAKKGLPFRWLERPVVGKMIKDVPLQKKFNPKGEGIIFETKKNAEVVAPSKGLVVFKGPFQSQGDILILDHGEKVYTILMGMHKIDVDVGQSIYAGQKLGMMAGYGARSPKLYLELRQKGVTIDPMPYLAE